MGLSFHELNLLKLAAKSRSLGDAITLGRQNLNLSRDIVELELRGGIEIADHVYVEDFMIKAFDARSVRSLDFSDYEGASYVGDLNSEIDLGSQFDTVIDFGTIEHVFDVGAAFRNIVRLCRLGGQILHSVPSNSDCGHGFYQFSPELFFSLYTEGNGFQDTVVYIADVMDERHWWRALRPEPGKRLAVNSLSTTYALCRTTKIRGVERLSVQQSDYQHAWAERSASRGGSGFLDAARRFVKGTPLSMAGTVGYRTLFARTGLTRFNPYLKRLRISDEIA